MRKFLAAILGVTCVSCVAAATACTQSEPNYFELTYIAQDGVTFDFGEIKSGAGVREGYVVSFTVDISDELVGEPVVQRNDEEIVAGDDGKYSFTMDKAYVITVSGIRKIDECEVFFEAGDNRIKYYDADGKEITDERQTFDSGDTVSFTLTKSVYYTDDKFQVTANSIVLEPDGNGVYSFEVMNATTVAVSGLVQEPGFTDRTGTGAGTADNPYLISRPIDLYYIAALVEDPFYLGRFASAHYKLTADIDMKGEQLFIIGEYPEENSIATFMGEFDGNGHSISNYYIEDHIIDQSNGEEVALPYIGLFGVASATANSNVRIHDLTLENFEIEVDGSKIETGFYVGGLVGFGMGVEITNCTVNGTVTAYGNSDTFGYVGGIIGRQQSFYQSEDLYYYSIVDSCSSDVEITCASGNFYGAGGITAIAVSAAENASTGIINSYSVGNLSGAMNAGGIVGISDAYTSVVNCYSTGEVAARSNLTIMNGQDTYCHASAGGIVGHLGSDALVANCFSVSDVSASVAVTQNPAKFRHTGGIAGRKDESGGIYINSEAPAVHNSYSGSEVKTDETFFKNSLGWTDGVWTFGNGYPVLKTEGVSGGYNITVVLPKGVAVKQQNTVVYTGTLNSCISDLYREANGKAAVDMFLTADSGARSYGYFFDADFKNPVPSTFVPLGNVTLYAGFADYSEVAGTYYIRNGGNNNYIVLGTDGSLYYRSGAVSYNTYYIYNGQEIVLQPSPASMLAIAGEEGEQETQIYVVAKAVKAEELVFDFIYRTSVAEAPASGSFTAVVKNADFGYGTYYSEGYADYTFNADGTGAKGNAAFTFAVSSNGQVVTINLANGNKELAQVTSAGLTIGTADFVKYDAFRGVWEKSFTTHETYGFDGKGGWTYEKFTYASNGNKTEVKRFTGRYTLADGVLTLDNGYTVSFEGENLCVFNGNYSEEYYRENSFVGEWRLLNLYEPVTLVFGGLNGEGYGEVTVSYGTSEGIQMNYEVIEANGAKYILIVLEDVGYGQLIFDASNETLTGDIYSVLKNGTREDVLFCLYDDFKGLWISSEFGEIEFNGLGNYNVPAGGEYTRVQGAIKINGRTAGSYTLEKSLAKGEFTYNKTTYTIEYDVATGKTLIGVKGSDEVSSLVRPDGMHGLVLVDAEGTRYEFDGGSALEGGGTLTVGSEVYTYVQNGQGYAISSDGGTEGSLVLDGDDYKLTLGTAQAKVLTVENPFTGSWAMGGVNIGNVEIGKINGSLQASGSYLGEAVTFDYDAENGYLSFKHGGATLYILALGKGDRTELSISERPDTLGERSLCVRFADLDSFRGEYVAADGAKVVLDGLLNSGFGAATASVWDKDGNLSATYTYTVNTLGELEFRNDGTFIFAKTANGVYAHGSDKFDIIKADWFYLRSNITDAADDSIKYVFDGHGTVRTNSGVTYSYEIIGLDEVRYIYNLTFTDKDGTAHAVEYDVATRKITFLAGEGKN